MQLSRFLFAFAVVHSTTVSSNETQDEDCRLSELFTTFSEEELTMLTSRMITNGSALEHYTENGTLMYANTFDQLFSEFVSRRSSRVPLLDRNQNALFDDLLAEVNCPNESDARPHDFLLSESGRTVFFRKGTQIFISSLREFLHCGHRELLFETDSREFQFIFANAKNSLLFSELRNGENKILVYDYVTKRLLCVFRALPIAVFKQSKGGLEDVEQRTASHRSPKVTHMRSEDNFSWVLVAAIASISVLILAALIIGCILYCINFSRQTNTITDDYEQSEPERLPPAFVEAARKAVQPPSMEGKYLPVNFETSEFNFKGSLVIDRSKPLLLQMLMDSDKPITNSTQPDSMEPSGVQFDTKLNQVFDTGESVEMRVGILPKEVLAPPGSPPRGRPTNV